MAQRGYLGIHAEVPTAQYLRSASVVNGALRSTSTPPRGGLIADLAHPVVHPSDLWEQSLLARRPDCRPGSPGRTPISLWERACSRRRH